MQKSFQVSGDILKVNKALGLVFGWGMVCKVDGVDYFDVQGDHAPEDSMLESAAEFMRNSRLAKDMHVRKDAGQIIFAFPLTTEIAKAFDITTKKTGLLIAMEPDAEMLAKFDSGEYKGFSIGGSYDESEEVE